MKKTIIIIGIVILLLNTIIGGLSSSYQDFNVVLVDVSILLTVVLLYIVVESQIADGFRIGLSVLFSITGLARVGCALVANKEVEDNVSIIILLILLAFEVICFVITKFLDSK